eukprot:COSAG02_NODE_7557_length_2961_cov_9.324948_1_plen_97_part_00
MVSAADPSSILDAESTIVSIARAPPHAAGRYGASAAARDDRARAAAASTFAFIIKIIAHAFVEFARARARRAPGRCARGSAGLGGMERQHASSTCS